MGHTPGRACLALFLLALTVTATWAETERAAPEKLGTVSFANSCNADVQADLARGVALLHSFWWAEGIRTFQAVLARDPDCAIATWGIATLDIANPFATGPNAAKAQEAQEAIARGRSIGAKTEREKLYIEAIAAYYDKFAERTHGQRMQALSDAFEALAQRYPDDDETQIFDAIYLVGTQDPTDKTFARTLKAAGILEKQFQKHPDHPGVAHYLIHSYDYPPIAERGLPAARRYAEIAPSAPHALHMPSHIFTRVGAWEESIATNQRSVEASKKENTRDEQLHAMDYMVYAELQLARDTQAAETIAAMREAAGGAKISVGYFAMAASSARYALERGQWRDAAQLPSSDSPIPFVRAMPPFARAIGAARAGDAAAAEKDLPELAQLVDALKTAKNMYWASEVEVQRVAATAWVAYAKGDRDGGLALMREAADLEDKSEKSAATPGRLVPARELLGDMLLESGHPAEALAEYEASQLRDPRRFRGLYGAGQAAAQAGNRDKARYFYTRLAEMVGAGGTRPELDEARRYLASN
ncbi:MAG TPA: hypothetical protein VET85_00660 [Stellaceae bacterium]|nr:hypothetical protein [Stellaceae bacterium]